MKYISPLSLARVRVKVYISSKNHGVTLRGFECAKSQEPGDVQVRLWGGGERGERSKPDFQVQIANGSKRRVNPTGNHRTMFQVQFTSQRKKAWKKQGLMGAWRRSWGEMSGGRGGSKGTKGGGWKSQNLGPREGIPEDEKTIKKEGIE